MGLETLPIASIVPNPDQPRKTFARESLEELAASIKSLGVMEPIVVRPHGGGYIIVAGERRWRASQLAGLECIPAIIRDDLTERTAFELSMVENVMRVDMNPIEEANGYRTLLDAGLELETISERLGKSVASIRGRLKLLGLAPAIRDMVASGQLSAWDGAQLARVSTEGQFRVIRSLAAGELRHPNDLDRLVSIIQTQEQQTDLFSTAEVEVVGPERRRAERDALAEIERAAQSISRATALLEQAVHSGSADRLSDEADGLKKLAARFAVAVHTKRVQTAAQVSMEVE